MTRLNQKNVSTLKKTFKKVKPILMDELALKVRELLYHKSI